MKKAAVRLRVSLYITLIVWGNLASAELPNDEEPATAAAVAEPALTKLPELIEFVEAEYPQEARRKNLTGDVILSLIVNEKGDVETAEVVQSAGRAFDESALNAVKKFRFSPAEMNGEPVPVRITYRYSFVLREQAETPATKTPIAETAEDESALEEERPATFAPVNLIGRVLERGTRAPIVGASVYIVNQNLETITDEDGRFEFRGVKWGLVQISVPVVDYETLNVSEVLKENELLELTLYIERTNYTEYSVTVRGKKPKKEVTRRTIEVEEILKVPGTQGDALKVIQNLPGAARSPGLSGMIILRGADPEDTNVYLEGIGIPFLYHFGALSSVVNSNILKSVDVYPGNYGVYYGRAIGGAVEVKTRPAKSDRWHGQADINMIDSSIMFETPIGENASIIVAGRRSYFDFLMKLAIPKDAPINMLVAPRYYDYQLRLDYAPHKDHSFMFFFLGDDDKMELILSDPSAMNDFNLSNGFQLLIPRWTWKITDKLTMEMTPSLQYFHFTIDVGDLTGGTHAKERAYSMDLREHFTFEFNKQLTFNLGGMLYVGQDKIAIRAPRPPKEGEVPTMYSSSEFLTLEDEFQWVSGSIYFETIYFPIERWQLIPGVRFDRFDFIEANTVDPRFSTRFRLREETSLKGAVGLYHQSPQGDEMVEKFGNPELGPENSIQYSLGFEEQLSELISLDVTGFYKDLNNLVSRSDKIVERNGEMMTENYSNEGEGRAYGAEFMLRHEVGKYFFGWLAYTLSWSERKDMATGDWRPFDWDQRHILTLLGTFRLPKNWEVGARFRFVTGNAITPLNGSTYDTDAFNYIPYPGKTNSDRLPPFHQLDIRVDKKFIWNWVIMSIYLDVINVYFHKHAEGEIYNYDWTEKEYFIFAPIIPSLGIKLEI
ncbi:MAG: TonB-dependent receptor [Myxococcota bacterium]